VKINHIHLMLGASLAALAMPVAAMAQDTNAAAAQPEVTSDVVPDTDIDAAKNADALLMAAQVEALQAQINELKKSMTVANPTWKGAPQWVDKDAGWSFKLRGRFMYDTAYISNPDNYDGASGSKALGFDSRVRRMRIGVEGAMPGGFGYKAEVDFANGSVGFGDVVMSYAPAGKPWSVTIGNQESLDGLEQMTSSRYSSFIERAAFNDAFIDTRRLGIVFGLKNNANTLRFDTGLFAAHSIDSTTDNDGWIGAARLVYAPMALGGQLHFGLNYQHREFSGNLTNGTTTTSGTSSASGAPSNNQLVKYRARPQLQTTGERFVDTGDFAAKSDDVFGAEFVGIFKSLHVVAEGQMVKTNAYKSGEVNTGLDTYFPSSTPNVSAYAPSDDPTFWGGYVEVGYFLTGETRGYKNGLFDRTKVLKPFDQGGWGALQINARLDYLDLDSKKLKRGCTQNFTSSTPCTLANNLSKGGIQIGYQTSLVWSPMDYFRFTLQYIHLNVEGGPKQSLVNPTSTEALDKRSFSVDSMALRAAFDF
jgi:phosphate-selective porin OprO/OprP